MKLSFELTPDQAEKLQSKAERLGIQPEDLAKAVVADLLATPKNDFLSALETVLKKNKDLYDRLS